VAYYFGPPCIVPFITPGVGLFWLGPPKYRNPPKKHRHPSTNLGEIQFDNQHRFRIHGYNRLLKAMCQTEQCTIRE